MKTSPNEPITEITNAASDRILTVGTVDGEASDLNAEANLTFDGSTLAVTGNLTVTGTTTTVSTTNTVIKDQLIELGNGNTGTASGDAGLIVERGSDTNAGLIWDESGDTWVACTTAATGASTGDLTLTDAALKAASLDISGNVDVDGTLEADAITVDGTALNTVIAGVTVTNATNAVNATNATNATHVSVADNENTDENNLITFIENASATGNVGLESDGDFHYNPSSGTVTAAVFKGNIDAVDGDFDGTLEADSITVGGTNLTAIYSPIAGSSSITTVGTVGTGTWQGTAIASAYLDADTAHLSGTQTFTGAKTFSSDVVISGTTPTLTIGDAGAEDTTLLFDGNAADFRIGIDDGTDTLEIGKGGAHGTDAVIKIASTTNLTMMLNSGVADGEYSGTIALFTAGEDLTAGEVVYLKSDGKLWKAVATAAATSRAVAMAVASVSANAMGPFLLKGFARFDSEFPQYTVGGALYTPEAETSSKNVPEQTAPDSDGDFVQVIGYAVSADSVYFDPDSTVIEVA
ncbi:MAG: hypothetical protein Unbinned4944contig1000_23 [Prokaryotic dsDNA virus sp.]|nr:MAG: hypothetical protein Unbinned4944contig1000_23 [Prokaryotic dsDNA virus sp.]|tara:strand:+ start:788 stop:2356 length:1569 start_codon:yes stop_codon:yes gene_type:complete